MTTRSRHTRPNSAVYLGSDPLHLASTPPGIPDLPEPPSPVSSAGSGLPSPPATNSTGSTGDPASIAVRGTTKSAASMLNASNIKAFNDAFTHDPPDDDDDDDDDDRNDYGIENEEDITARLNRRHSLKSVSVNENTLAIQRALTLKERTRMTIDKLSSYSRNSPSPSAHTRSSDSSSSTSRRRLLEQHHSGSETERELLDSEPRPSTPRIHRARLISAPASPGKALLSIKQSNSTSFQSSNSPSRTRKRVSIATSEFAEITSGRRIRSPDIYESSKTSRRLPDIAQAALAAVASSRGRMSPTASAKKRQPLPKEFFNAPASNSASNTSVSRRGSLSSSNTFDIVENDQANGRLSTEPLTPHQTSRPPSSMKHLQLSPRQQKNLNNTLTHSSLKHPFSDPRSNLERSSTLRRHQTGGRWVSDDMSAVSSLRTDGEQDRDYHNVSNSIGRRQTLRTGGSADSALTVGAGRSLVGEGLKAAGLRNGGTVGRRGDIFDDNTPLREKSTRDMERARRVERIERSISRTGTRSRSTIGWEDEDEKEEDESNSSNTRSRAKGSDTRTRAGTVVGPRASTSMAILDREREGVGGEPEPRTAPPHLRSYKSSYDLVLSQEALSRKESDLDKDTRKDGENRVPSSLDRYAPSPFGNTRRFVPNVAYNATETSHSNFTDRSDHTRLLHDSLHMFETHVTRVPSTSSATASDLLRNAQNIVGAAEKLNLMARVAMTKALDAQINAEVDGGTGDLVADIWRAVGADYRDQMRVSDELVRSVTDFLLGVGRAVKDMTGGGDGHGRSVSLDELRGGSLARSNLGSDGGSAGSGRRSEGSRRSWGDDMKRLSTGPQRSESALSGRPLSVLNTRDLETPPSLRSRLPNGSMNATRAQEFSRGDLGTFDSQETLHAVSFDPSPTPASRAQSNRNQDRSGATLDRARTLPPLSIPKPFTQPPSESLARRQTQTPIYSVSRRRPNTSASNTVRGPFPLSSPNVPTTALTPHTVSNSERQDFPILRSNSGSGSGKSSGATPRSTVTFSRSSTVSALTGLQQQQQLAEQQRQRKRTQSNSSAAGAEAAEPVSRVSRTTSGSETERGPIRTIGRQGDRARISLDGSGTLNGNVHPADRSAATSILVTSKPRERRKTVVDMWPRGES
ncbi:hypothetical protein J3R30DRAFT_3459518 [Lentinula aciculospora]|uniref:Uncharacterized protein n=1 Tax=Lentinula aciculospora TaxID=153920 RepID=A0A9W9AIK8_9AGAR|nr:hypothetical protein J3R30DRAFT_3459518 [Lentinula aciculospora]